MVRKLILEKLQEKGLNMAEASLRIGRNQTYLQQFLKRGFPAELKEPERIRLAEMLGVPESELRGPSSPLPSREYSRTIAGARDMPIASPAQPSIVSNGGQQEIKTTPGQLLVGYLGPLKAARGH